MYDLKNFSVGGYEYVFICSARNTRSGFAHDCELKANNITISCSTVHYLNRTWENYRYQTVMKKAVSSAIEDCYNELKYDFLRSNGYNKLTAKRKNVFETSILNNNDYSVSLNELYKEV